MNEENNVPLVVINESQVERTFRKVLILGHINSVQRGQISKILSVVDQKKGEIGRELSGDEVVEIARELVLVREEFDLPTKMFLEIKRFCEEEKETYLREIEGSFKVQKRQKFKSPYWNF